MTQKISQKGVKIIKIGEDNQEKTYQFCMSIFNEMGWPKEFAYGFKKIKEFFSKPRELFLLAKEDGRIIACAGLKELSDKEGLMKRFYVAKDFRGKGLAEMMLAKIKEFAKEKKYKTIVLDIFRDNLRAKKFFQRNGFIVYNPCPDKNWPESKHPKIFEFRKLDL